MNRRNFIKLASAVSLAATISSRSARAQQSANGTEAAATQPPFSEEWLINEAERLAGQAFEQPQLELPAELNDLDRRQYGAIRFKEDATIWKNDPSGYNLQLFHAGFQYTQPVELNLIEGDTVRPVVYSPTLFDFKDPLTPPPAEAKGGFSGVKLLGPLNGAGSPDAFLAFQGATLFRAIAANQAFGAVARGIAINTAQSKGEEIPFFRALWIKKPEPGERVITLFALLDSSSLTGAYKFTVESGRSTVMEVSCSLFPRRRLEHVGIAPINSMYFFGAADPTRIDDYRPNVHSSHGLQIWNTAGEWIWRPVINPEQLQYSVFLDRTPKGFGLLQRKRAFSEYEDIDARFGDRPSVWVEPLEDWGDGAVDLIEVPSRSEIYDNIIAFWRPKTPLAEKTRRSFRYRLHWCWEPPLRNTHFTVFQTRTGPRGGNGQRYFVIDFVRGHSCNGCDNIPFEADIRAGAGEDEIRNVTIRKHPVMTGQRVAFEFRPDGEQQADLRCQLKQNGQVVSETWVYRWTN